MLDVKRHSSLTDKERAAARAAGTCTIKECEGVDMLASIKADFFAWKKRGGITLADTEAAQKKGCAVGEEDGHYFDCIQGWVRVMISNNTLYATHFGEGFGTRDGVFLVALLELLERHQVPDVDFILQPGDRAKVCCAPSAPFPATGAHHHKSI